MSVSGLGNFANVFNFNFPTTKASPYIHTVSGTAAKATDTSSITEPPAPSTVVTLSAKAKQSVTQSGAQLFADVGNSARVKLDALKQKAAEKTGIAVNALNVQKAGLLDYSGFSDQELAAMAKNSSKNFSQAEQDHAQGVLADRVKISVEAFAGPAVAGDWRRHGMAINALYEVMSPEVRSALGWTPVMLAANNRMVEDDENKYGELDMNDLLTSLQSAQHKGGLTFQQTGGKS